MASKDQYILVTGANSGLGLGICRRLTDDFLARAGADETLTIIFTTRSSRKAADTLAQLERHLAKHDHGAQRRSKSLDRQVYFQPESVDLTNLLSVRALARKLVASDLPRLDAVVLNAGIGGWSGLDWPLAVWKVMTQIRQATTWPTFNLGLVGLAAQRQLPANAPVSSPEEPALGQVFCANVFGHYLLVHWTMALLRACPPKSPGKIIWTSSIEASRVHYNPADHQGLATSKAYEHSKRLIDVLALTAQNQAATAIEVKRYTTPPSSSFSHTTRSRPEASTPDFHVAHPGICATAIVEVYWIVFQFYTLGVYLARWCGSPWANVSGYKGAMGLSWLALASSAEIKAKELEAAGSNHGPVKWGASTSQLGTTTVRPTDTDGWGLNGTGIPYRDTWWGGNVGRKFGATDATEEDVENFVSTGAGAWKAMEQLREQWEGRIEAYEAESGSASNGKPS